MPDYTTIIIVIYLSIAKSYFKIFTNWDFMLLKDRNDHSAAVELWTLCWALSFALFLGHVVVHGDPGEETGQDWDSEKELFINQTYLRKMFKSEVGKTIWEYLTEYRMEIAVQLLLSTDFNSNKIAEMTGYSDVGYFGKCFPIC